MAEIQAVDELPSDVAAHRAWLLELVPKPTRGTWLDLGCGRGRDVIVAAQTNASPLLHFIGLDASEEAITAAEKRDGSEDPRIEFRAAKIETTLSFESASVDVVYSNNLMECLPDRDAFVREVARVRKPGGWTVTAHWDWDSQTFDSRDKTRVRRIVSAFSDWQQGWMDHSDGWMGRRLWGAFNSTGLFDGTVHARVMTNTSFTPPWYGHARAQDFRALAQRGLVAERDVLELLAEQKELEAQGRYFYSITGFAYVGRRTA